MVSHAAIESRLFTAGMSTLENTEGRGLDRRFSAKRLLCVVVFLGGIGGIVKIYP